MFSLREWVRCLVNSKYTKFLPGPAHRQAIKLHISKPKTLNQDQCEIKCGISCGVLLVTEMKPGECWSCFMLKVIHQWMLE